MRSEHPATALITAVFIPISILLYSTWTMHVGSNLVGLIDHLALVLIFLAMDEVLLRMHDRWGRALGSLALTAFTACFFLFNTLHFRFFSTWGEVNAVQQWSDLASILTGIESLLRPADWIFFIVLPLGLWIVSVNAPRPSRRRVGWLELLTIGVLLLVHPLLASSEILYSENNPLLYAVRQKFKSRSVSTVSNGSGADFQRYQGINPSLYRNPGRSDYPFMKIPREHIPRLSVGFSRPPNVVFILMESVRAYESGAYGARPSMTPHIDRLAREGWWFENFYANGSQTVRSEFAILASFMPRMIGSPEYITDPHAPFLTWPMILRRRGYRTMWIGSYSPTYDNKQDFLSHHGIDAFYWSLPKSSRKVGWGPPDEDLFAYARDVLAKQQAPYFAEIMTLSNHYPWDDGSPTAGITPHVNGEPLYQKYAQGMFYTDYAIGKFFDRVRRDPAFENTLFILCGDHGIWLFPDDPQLSHSVLRQEVYFRVPLVMWCPAHLPPRTVRTLGSQVDIGPTVLDLLGIHVTNYFLGSSLLRNDVDKRFVLMVQDGRWNLRQGQLFTYDIGPQVFQSHYPFDEDAYNRLIKGKTVEHLSFTFDGDLLRNRHPPPLQPLDPTLAGPLREFAEGALQAYQTVLQQGKTAPKNEGLTTPEKSEK